jgi:hypothetical protein
MNKKDMAAKRRSSTDKAFDYSELQSIERMDPLSGLWNRYKDNAAVVKALAAYDMYFKPLIIIWLRLKEDIENADRICTRLQNQIYNRPSRHRLSPQQLRIFGERSYSNLLLRVDYESFLIFACILMDKIPRLAASLLPKDDVPPDSFHRHKNFFLQCNNIPYPANEEYAKLIREETEWFDISLKLARDNLITHGSTYDIQITRRRRTEGIILTLDKTKSSGSEDFSKEQEKVIKIKQKYQHQYRELTHVEDNLWEILYFLMNHDIRMDKTDKTDFISVVHKTGGSLPTPTYVYQKLISFLKNFYRAFA